jgi:phosphoglycerate dehydrogenase-like enzyme
MQGGAVATAKNSAISATKKGALRMKVAFAGSFAVRLAEPVMAQLAVPCEVIADDEARIMPRLADTDVLVSMGFTREMAEAGRRLRLIQVPGAGLDRIDRSALRPGMHLANAYGHEAGIAEYVIGAMIALTRSFGRIDAKLRSGEWRASGLLARRRHRCGQNSPARRSVSSDLATSERHLPAVHGPST